MFAKHAEMQEHVAVDVVADDESEPAGRVEPFHPAGDRRASSARRLRRPDSMWPEPPPQPACTRDALITAHINMAACVGKPTLHCGPRSASSKHVEVDFAAGGKSTIARASANPWPARTIAARAFLALARVTSRAAANGPIRRRRAKRTAAATACSSAWSTAATAVFLLDAGGVQLLRRAGACHSRVPRSACALFRAKAASST